MKHTCFAVVVGCIDFRLRLMTRKFIDKYLEDKEYDIVRFAGGVKEIGIVFNQIELSVRLHNIKKAILVNHEDCGAYGAEGTKEKHIKDLNRARKVLLALHPDLDVETYYLHLDGTFEKIKS